MKHIIIGTAGHVDHGKTALIKAMTKIDCDTHKEEKRRGITINLGFSYLNLPLGESVGIIDVPGHKDFINTMVSGACGIDLVLLVIAADSGIMPQTVEHINIIQALGINRGIVALTKTDLVDDELIEMAKFEISDFLATTSIKDARVIGVSSLTKQGIDELIAAIADCIQGIEARPESDLFRMYIDRIFSVKGHGIVVTGSVLGGSIKAGNDVFLLPGLNQKLRIRSIERHGQQVDMVMDGDRAAINLIGMKNEDFHRGQVITDRQIDETSRIDAFIKLFDKSIALPLWSHAVFISGTYECQARIHLLNKEIVNPGEDAIVQIHLNKPTILVNADKFILRNTSGEITLGGGYIIDTAPLHHKKRRPDLIKNLSQLTLNILNKNSTTAIICTELRKEFRPFLPAEIAGKLNISLDTLFKGIQPGSNDFKIYHSNETDIFIDLNYDQNYRAKILKILHEYHAKFPIFQDGLDTREISGKLGLSANKTGKIYLDLLLENMKTDGLVEQHHTTWIIKDHKPVIGDQMKEEIYWLENTILQYDIQKPVLSEIEDLALSRNISKVKIRMYLDYLVRQGKIQYFQADFIHTDILKKFRPVLLKKLTESESGIEINEFKDIIGGTKRFRALLADIYESEKIISFQRGSGVETKISITPEGRKLLKETSPGNIKN